MVYKKYSFVTVFLLVFSASLLFLVPAAFGESTDPYIRVDKHGSDVVYGELSNVRFLADDLFEFQEPNGKYDIDPDFTPSKEGLDTLCISGSAQFSIPQFKSLAEDLRSYAGNRTVYILDLRRESHVLVNEGFPLSWYGLHNWTNLDMSTAEIEADEINRFEMMIGKTISAYYVKSDFPSDPLEIEFRHVITERDLVEGEGFAYIRLPIQDHTWPKAEEIDAFVSLIRSIDPEQSWLHFHCQAGKGRTGIMMTLYDMMINPDVPMEDIVVRQTLLGGSYSLYTGDYDSYKAPYYEEKARMTPMFYAYVQDQHESNYEIPWSAWLEEQEALLPAA